MEFLYAPLPMKYGISKIRIAKFTVTYDLHRVHLFLWNMDINDSINNSLACKPEQYVEI